jgi:hypothetical protein
LPSIPIPLSFEDDLDEEPPFEGWEDFPLEEPVPPFPALVPEEPLFLSESWVAIVIILWLNNDDNL